MIVSATLEFRETAGFVLVCYLISFLGTLFRRLTDH